MEREVREILEENERRHLTVDAPFDPITGEGSTGRRALLHLPDYKIKRQYVPLRMLEEPLVAEIAKAGSIGEYLRSRGGKGLTATGVGDLLTRIRCRHDFPFWAASFAYVKRKGGGDDVLFSLNRPQRKFVETLERMRIAEKPIRLILLKARQWGGSTCSQLYMAWLQLIHCKGLNSLIISHQVVGSDEIKDMFDRMIERYPLEMLCDPGEEPSPGEKKMTGVGRSRAIFKVGRRNCKIKIGTAERPNSCRGGDYNLVHCSETGIWKATDGKTPEMICRSACAGILLSPMTMIVYESTANGTGNFFHREYEAAKRGESQFAPLFISWFDIDQYSLPVPDLEGFARRLWEGRKSEASGSQREQPGSYLWWLWERGATLEAIAWYIEERRKYNDHSMMAAEYPSDDVEAFVHSGVRVFDTYKVEALRAGCRQPLYRGEVEQTTRENVIHSGGVRFVSVRNGGLSVWALPASTMSLQGRYLVVVDVGGRALRSDWSVVAVFDRAPLMEGGGPELVAQWRGHADFDILAETAARIAALYHDALLVFESNTLENADRDRDTEGDQTPFIFTSLRRRYRNLYSRRAPLDKVGRHSPVRYGFHTNMSTKPMIITNLVRVIREGLYVERDEMCLDEYLSYERRQNGSYGAVGGCHDDLLMTRAIALHISANEMRYPERTVFMRHTRSFTPRTTEASF